MVLILKNETWVLDRYGPSTQTLQVFCPTATSNWFPMGMDAQHPYSDDSRCIPCHNHTFELSWVSSDLTRTTSYTTAIQNNDKPYLDGNKTEFEWALAPNSRSWNLFLVELRQHEYQYRWVLTLSQQNIN